MQTVNKITFLIRFVSAIVLNIIAVVYGFRGDYVPAVIFGLLAFLVWVLAFRALTRRPHGGPGQPGGKE